MNSQKQEITEKLDLNIELLMSQFEKLSTPAKSCMFQKLFISLVPQITNDPNKIIDRESVSNIPVSSQFFRLLITFLANHSFSNDI